MKFQRHDNQLSDSITICLNQILTQVLGAIAFSGSVIVGVVTFSVLSHSMVLGSNNFAILFTISVVAAAIALFIVRLCVGLVRTGVKFLQDHSHSKTFKRWSISHVHH